ncbi:CDP-glycerol glycerophosphotransferase family protein [Alkalibaculum sporogenes]|nr:CDP-glycerol glycerophosphotransferase family protein [Alkalibaculum sporogenes]
MEKFIALIVVKVTWLFTFAIPVNKKKITFISYFENKLTGNFKLISKELQKRDNDYKLVFLIHKFNNSLLDKLYYVLYFAIQTYHINTSAIVLLDGNNFPVCNITKKKQTTIIQIWHACGGIKKFGYDINRRFDIKNYDYVYVAGNEFKCTFSSAFQVEQDKVISLGVAKTDILYNEGKMESYKELVYNKYPQIKNKKVVLYAPTFRGDGAFDRQYVNIDLEYLYNKLGQDYILLYKLHPFLESISLGKDNNDNIINVNNIDLYKLFSVTDILISDYSAIIFDFSILERPIILYTPDLVVYEEERGFYYNYREFAPGPICFNEEEIAEVIATQNYKLDRVQDLKYKYFDYHDGLSTQRIANDIEDIISRNTPHNF